MKIADKNNSAVEMVKSALEKAKKYESYNIFISINEDVAINRAKEIDEKISKGEKVGRLAGVPFACKDNFLGKQGATTAAAKILEPLNAPLNATTIEKLEAEGAIMIGRVNMDAFAHGSSTENSFFGVTKNAVDTERVAGGSSGGSAAAVALDIVPFATGTDTGGSIRQPASFNGVYGIKPTYGTISRYGVIAMGSSLDVIGFITRNAEDLDLLMEVCAGQDPKDLTSLPDYYNATAPKEPKKIGVLKDFDSDSIDSSIRQALQNKLDELRNDGYEIVDLEMPILKYALAVYYIIMPAEVTSNLSRYDGVRYGYRSDEAKDLDGIFCKSRSEGFMKENKRRIMVGNFVLSSGFYDAYFLKAMKARTLIIQAFNNAFEKCDYILAPVSPNPAFKIGEKANDPVAMYMEDILSVTLNLAGLPGVALPVSKNADGLPIGLQLIGPRRSDKNLIKFAGKIGLNVDKENQ